MSKILYVEDNEIISNGVKQYLKNEGIEVEICQTISKAKERLKNNSYDLILLDIILPDGDGTELYDNIKNRISTPVIFLTAKDSEDDIVKCMDLGADDYIIKTFRMRELTSRIKSVLRRNEISSIIKIENITFDEKNNVVYKNEEQINLTALEYRILSILIENINKLVTREYLLGRIWDVSAKFVNDNTLTVYMKRLREKIEDNPSNPKIIKTIRGIGYKIESKEYLKK